MLPALGSRVYHLSVRLAALAGNKKAKQWVAGRAAIPEQLEAIEAKRRPQQKLLWFHAASLGEFEQGMPVLEMVRENHPDVFLVLTFFSPSGYLARKNYETVDAVLYLPDDNLREATNWIDILQPNLAVFVKYEFWPAHLAALKKRKVPTVLISGAFRAEQAFFKWYGRDWVAMLGVFQKLLVQTAKDAALLAKLPLSDTKIVVAGDPRMDRVLSLAQHPFQDKVLVQFIGGRKCLLAGSVWAPDVDLLAGLIEELPTDWCLVMAPHRLKEEELKKWSSRFSAVRYSTVATKNSEQSGQVMLMDTIGILSRSYRYADLAYVGGGFGSGLHNTLEPMAYGLPVIFGPKYGKFTEAIEMVNAKGCFSVTNVRELVKVFQLLSENDQEARSAVLNYVNHAKGATLRTYRALLPYI